MSRLTFEERVKIMDWLDKHRDEAKNLSVSELIPRIRADIPLRALSRDAVKEAAKVRGVAFGKRRGLPSPPPYGMMSPRFWQSRSGKSPERRASNLSSRRS